MAIDADFAIAVEVIEDDILLGQGVLIRRDLFAEDGQLRIAVGVWQVAELLIVGPVLLDDVDDVLDRRLTHPLPGE